VDLPTGKKILRRRIAGPKRNLLYRCAAGSAAALDASSIPFHALHEESESVS